MALNVAILNLTEDSTFSQKICRIDVGIYVMVKKSAELQ